MTNRTLFLRPGISRYFTLAVLHGRGRRWQEDDASHEAQNERDLKEAGKLRKQAAKLNNIGINSGSDLLMVKTKQLRSGRPRSRQAVRPAHRSARARSG